MVKKAFTLIELIFIIVLVGIMSSVAVSAFREDKLALATYQVLEHIRYTQHLAITDHKFDPKEQSYKTQEGRVDDTYNGNYHRSRWRIEFSEKSSTLFYSVYSDRDRRSDCDVSSHIEPAVDPQARLLLYYCMPTGCSTSKRNENLNLTSKYGIIGISQSGYSKLGYTVAFLAFDEKGRPYTELLVGTNNVYKKLITAETNITLTHQDGRSSVITIYPETGYAEITKLE